MKCPRCLQLIHRAADRCPHCGFCIEKADQVFELETYRLSILTDELGVFRATEKERIEEEILKFRKRFPQLFIAVYTGSFGNHEQMREFGFWLLNRADFNRSHPQASEEGGILILFDPILKTACLTYGYLLEPFICEDDTFDCLSRAHSYWLQGSYVDGLLKCIDQLRRLLARRSLSANFLPWKWRNKTNLGIRRPNREGEVILNQDMKTGR